MRLNTQLFARTGLTAGILTLAACGGGGGSTSTGPSTAGALTLTGVAATGQAIGGATVSAVCAAASATASTTTTTDATTGAYTLTIAGGALPCVIELSATNGTVLHSVAQGSGSSATANISPLTELIAVQLFGSAVDTVFSNFNAAAQAKVGTSQLTAASAAVASSLQGVVSLSGVNPITDPIAAGSGTGLDGTLDTLGTALAASGVTLATLSSAIVASGGQDTTVADFTSGLYVLSISGSTTCYTKIGIGAQLASGDYAVHNDNYCANGGSWVPTAPYTRDIMAADGSWVPENSATVAIVGWTYFSRKFNGVVYETGSLKPQAAASGSPAGSTDYAFQSKAARDQYYVDDSVNDVYQNAATISDLLRIWSTGSLSYDGTLAWSFGSTGNGVNFISASCANSLQINCPVLASSTWIPSNLPGGNDGIEIVTPNGFTDLQVSGDASYKPFYVKRAPATGDTGVRSGVHVPMGASSSGVWHNRLAFDALMATMNLPASVN
ncbi:MAG: hypothetical protein KGL43_18335 [Burkholderiales bacterium]|nr:hypothetical protein [Burkholderiales bacterium]MDE2455551.1 hypothetical protein [Burkholderiales bacterium]